MLRPTFLGYKTATGAIKVNQYMLDIVGQNMANVNTQGYTRQRLDINSVAFSASNMKLGTTGVIIGQGVEAKGVSQFRDSFLDLRYRMESSKAGSEYVQYEALKDLENILDEIPKDDSEGMYGLDAQFSDLLRQLHSLRPSDPVSEGVVRTSAQMLAQMLNNYSQGLKTIEEQQSSYLKDGAIVDINLISENIAKLNKQIRESNISGNPALELNDERNVLIDELSTHLDIEVDVEPLDIGGGKTIDELVIRLRGTDIELVNRNFSNTVTISGAIDITKINITQFEKDASGNVILDSDGKPEYAADENITSTITGGQIDGYLKFLNGKGEFATNDDTKEYDKAFDIKGVQYYQNMLDTLANKFAGIMNDLNKKPTFNDDGTVTWDDRLLFGARDGGEITAGNIKISDDWANATDSYITNTIIKSDGDSSGAKDNILRIIDSFQKSEDYTTNVDLDGNGTVEDGEKRPLFKGTFQEFFTYTSTKLNLQVKSAETSYKTYAETQFHIDYARKSMSSVDLNEEGVNLLQYSKSYNAAARLMTTLDEMLDTLINRMGV